MSYFGGPTHEDRVKEGKARAARWKAEDPDYYKKLGAKGGAKKVPKGFAQMTPMQHLAASRKGGANSKKKVVDSKH